MNILGNISIDTFLSEYWQKKPLLIRNAFPSFISPIDPDDLAGLAMEEQAESRMIFEHGSDGPWQLKHGPFSEDDFNRLPEKDWTLLVQAVDQWVPELSDIVDQFNFIPKWRLDDLMVSFAPKGGSVGPHFDQYDVFLLQAHGQRHWQIGPKYSENSAFLQGTDLKILQDMQVDEEWTLNPGDMLYIPPQYAHNGVALNDCMTFSIGFRAPSESDILSHFVDHACLNLNEDNRYSDLDLSDSKPQPALIDDKAIDRIQALLQKQLTDREHIAKWFAGFMTESKYEDLQEPLEEPLDWEEVAPFFQSSHTITQNETSRWAYTSQEGRLTLMINGKEVCATTDTMLAQLAQHLANHRHIKIADILHQLESSQCQELLLDLINENHIYFDDE
ncbi:cupin domain-containing protein [Oceaniserpentilla sp. 4NH20-0058]|uniref:ribosomal protein uL16 3-hydroxylase n=1 Tax=Oceaniserpentilla sp. 4NH20-0058 TaxID=3127660 RepID=UPI003103C5F1